MARPKPSLPSYGFNQEAMRLRSNSNVKVVVDRYEQGKVARRNFSVFDQLATNGKTVGDVAYLPTLTKNMAVAANNMFVLYATWKGQGGAPDNDNIGFVQCGRSEPELLTDRMKLAGEELARATSPMKSRNRKLLIALCHDMLTSDGAMLYTERAPKPDDEEVKRVAETEERIITRRLEPYEWGDPAPKKGFQTITIEVAKQQKQKPVVRWRSVVQAVTGINERECQRDAIKRLCADLIKALGMDN